MIIVDINDGISILVVIVVSCSSAGWPEIGPGRHRIIVTFWRVITRHECRPGSVGGVVDFRRVSLDFYVRHSSKCDSVITRVVSEIAEERTE